MRRTNNEESLGDVIKRLVNSPQWKNKITQHRLQDEWGKLMGATVVSRTRSLFFKDGKLYITFNSASLKQEIFYSKDLLTEKLNERLGENVVTEVIIK